MEQVLELDTNILQPNPLQPRSNITPESLQELIESIRAQGILQPLVVAKTPAGFQIIAGERRWRAAKIMGLVKIPVVIRETTARGMLEMAIVENVQREDLNPLERAQAYKRLMDEFNLTIALISQRVGKSQPYVSNTLRLLNLPDALKDGLASGTVLEGHVRALLQIKDEKTMIEAYKMVIKEGASVRDVELLARSLSKRKINPQATIQSQGDFAYEENELGRIMGAKLKIKQSSISSQVRISWDGEPANTLPKLKNFLETIVKFYPVENQP